METEKKRVRGWQPGPFCTTLQEPGPWAFMQARKGVNSTVWGLGGTRSEKGSTLWPGKGAFLVEVDKAHCSPVSPELHPPISSYWKRQFAFAVGRPPWMPGRG